MRTTFYGLLLLFFSGSFYSCTQEKAETPALTSGLLLENMDSTVKPGDDFQMFVNGTWIDETEIPADKSSYGVGYIVHEKSQDDVKLIIEESAAGENAPGSDEQKVGDLYSSYMDMETRNKLGVAPLSKELEKIDALTSHEELPGYFGYALPLGYGTPMGYYVYTDLKAPDQYAFYNYQAGLGLPEREYYLSDEGKFPSIREEYVKHMEKMLGLGGVENAASKAAVIMALETQLAEKHWKKEDTRDAVKRYNPFPVDSLDELMPKFNYKAYLSAAGIPDLEKIIISQPSYTLSLNEIVSSVDLDTWKAYLKWHVIHDAATYLNEEIDQSHFDFYSGVLRGTKEQLPRWRRAVTVVNHNLGEVVGKVYVKKHFPPEAKDRMSKLVENLTKAYEISIKELDWMGEETKVEALDKLSKFTPKIGYPDKWKDYSAIEIKGDDLFGNIQRSELAEHQREVNKLGGPIDKSEWFMTPQTVNAYYSPGMNEIVFPAAILQPPFFNLNADDAVNYGSIGAVIGHEIGHGFDDQGSTYDGDGKLRNWWTDQDREEFKKRTGALVTQYDAFKVFDDLNVNGEFTQGENIGDLGGLTIALKAYQLSLEGQESPVMDGYTGLQRVFLGYAQSWRSKSREEAQRMRVNTDPHSPAKFRVNGVVRNVPEFYTAFNIQEGDSLYLASEERVKIW